MFLCGTHVMEDLKMYVQINADRVVNIYLTWSSLLKVTVSTASTVLNMCFRLTLSGNVNDLNMHLRVHLRKNSLQLG